MLFYLLPLSILSLFPLYHARQVPIGHEPISTTSTTLVDALSADPDYTRLIRLLQRARLIPTLNRLNSTLFFAPTNDAIERYTKSNLVWSEEELNDTGISPHTMDNVKEKLRQDLLYHILQDNITLPGVDNVTAFKTFHYPQKPIEEPGDEPPPSPPWIPEPGGTLGGAPQLLRVTEREKDGIWTGVDFKGKGGAKVVKEPVEVKNGKLLGVGDVIEVPRDLAYIISHHPQLSYISRILPKEVKNLIKDTPALTLFLPVDKAWDTLDPIEKIYLESEFAQDDVDSIGRMHAVWPGDEQVKYASTLKDGDTLKTLFGSKLALANKDNNGKEISIGSSQIIEPDIYASNGVLHLVDSLLIPDGAISLTPEKYLLALNCTKFISLIHSVNLTQMVNYTSADTRRTILAVADDVLAFSTSNGGNDPDLPEEGSEELRKMLQYHFLPDKWTTKKLKDGMLVETELIEPGLNGSRQVLPVELPKDARDEDGEKDVAKGLRFAGVGVVGQPIALTYPLNNTVIYLLTRAIVPPSDALTTALPFLHFSSFIAAVFSTALDKLIKENPSTTILMPRNSAFERLGGLVSTHLLSSSADSKADLKSVIKHHIIQGVEYHKPLLQGSQTSFKSFEGSDLHLNRDNKTLVFTPSGGWLGMQGRMEDGDMLTETGVLHELSEIMIPRSVELTNSKLLKAAQGSTMGNLVSRAGMGWILNGTSPPEDSDWAKEDLDSVGWTLLCPHDDAFKGLNLTELWSDKEYLQQFVYQHIIPTPRISGSESSSRNVRIAEAPYQPVPLGDGSNSFTTLQSRLSLYGDVVFSSQSDGKGPDSIYVRIKDWPESQSQNASARVMAWGRCTTNGGTGGVIQIDRLMEPWQPTFWAKYGPPTATGVAGVGVIALFFWAVSKLWRRDTTEATYEPLNGYDGEDEVRSG